MNRDLFSVGDRVSFRGMSGEVIGLLPPVKGRRFLHVLLDEPNKTGPYQRRLTEVAEEDITGHEPITSARNLMGYQGGIDDLRALMAVPDGYEPGQRAEALYDLLMGPDGQARGEELARTLRGLTGGEFLDEDERRALGSYWTPPVLVDHLLGTALDPVLDEHFGQIE